MDVAISQMGTSSLLLDAAGKVFSETVQARIHATAAILRGRADVEEVVPGMNNLLVSFDLQRIAHDSTTNLLRQIWDGAQPLAPDGKTIDIPVTYGGPMAEDLHDWAAHCRMTIAEAVRRHAAPLYTVAAVGAMPGFVYLSGLDPSLAMGRRAVPRMAVPKGAVIIGGVQAGIMPTTAPSGWHIIGHTAVTLFDPHAVPPSLFQPGDRLRFVVAGVLA